MSDLNEQEDCGGHTHLFGKALTSIHVIICVRIFTAIFVITFIVLHAIHVGEISMDEILELYPTFITPASYALNIWYLIYLLLSTFSIYQLFPLSYSDLFINHISILACINALLAILWTLSYQTLGFDRNTLWISLVLNAMLFSTNFYVYYEQKRIKDHSWIRWVCTRAGYQVLLGWMIIAMMVNAFIVSERGRLLNASAKSIMETWAICWLIVIGCVGISGFGYVGRDALVMGTLVWAFSAIAVQQRSKSTPVFVTSIVLAVVLGLGSITVATQNTRLWMQRRRNKPIKTAGLDNTV